MIYYDFPNFTKIMKNCNVHPHGFEVSVLWEWFHAFWTNYIFFFWVILADKHVIKTNLWIYLIFCLSNQNVCSDGKFNWSQVAAELSRAVNCQPRSRAKSSSTELLHPHVKFIIFQKLFPGKALIMYLCTQKHLKKKHFCL